MFLYFVFYRSNLDFYLYNLYTRGNISERSDKIGQRVIGFEQIKIMESESNFSVAYKVDCKPEREESIYVVRSINGSITDNILSRSMKIAVIKSWRARACSKFFPRCFNTSPEHVQRDGNGIRSTFNSFS